MALPALDRIAVIGVKRSVHVMINSALIISGRWLDQLSRASARLPLTSVDTYLLNKLYRSWEKSVLGLMYRPQVGQGLEDPAASESSIVIR